MRDTQRSDTPETQRIVLTLATLAVAIGMTACSHAMMMISIHGGMPQHGHGLPTRPRVTGNLGDGIYEIEGVRFNMGGWWEFKVAITGSRGADTVIFNLDL